MFKEVLYWIAGTLTGIAWFLLNFFLTKSLLEGMIAGKSKLKTLLFLLVKFPLLYLVGFLVLFSKIFSPYSLLIGVTLALALIGALNVCRNWRCWA